MIKLATRHLAAPSGAAPVQGEKIDNAAGDGGASVGAPTGWPGRSL